MGFHFRQELANEKLDFTDAWHVLRTGDIYSPAERDIKSGDWKYRIEAHTADGIWLAIVFCFRAVDRAFLITFFSGAAWRRK